jgi:hypothetical protein
MVVIINTCNAFIEIVSLKDQDVDIIRNTSSQTLRVSWVGRIFKPAKIRRKLIVVTIVRSWKE